MGITAIRRGLAGSGLVATIGGDFTGPTVGIRFDMDALPVTESTGLPFSSKYPGRAHACGHDGHIAVGLGVAKALTSGGISFGGNVKLIFQPGEEYPGGARLMIRDGALEDPKVDAMLGFHIFPGLRAGTFGLRRGVMTARNDEFTVKITGRGGHGAYPHQCKDPVAACGTFITGVQNIVARMVSPVDSAVVTIGEVHGGRGHNVIPREVDLKGTVRTISDEGREAALDGLRSVAEAVARLHSVQVDIEVVAGEPPLVCSPQLMDIVVRALRGVIDEGDLTFIEVPSLGADDFAFYSEQIPALYIRVGSCAEGYENPLHNTAFDFPENILPGALFVVMTAAMGILNGLGRGNRPWSVLPCEPEA